MMLKGAKGKEYLWEAAKKKESLRGKFRSCIFPHLRTPGQFSQEVGVLFNLFFSIFSRLQEVTEFAGCRPASSDLIKVWGRGFQGPA